MKAETRFSASLSINDVTMLAAADELEAATREAKWWLAGNVCPDLELGRRVVLLLNICTEVALDGAADHHRSDRRHPGGHRPPG